ncbi:MAG TPA: sigma-70 family RNA polymerase sigma factor [Blastocatellia bacterium]|nr:sigma-70 family RNA polymerase sigma factor [Blastocatellia bacterium]
MGNEVTQLLADYRNGDSSALDRLFPLIYDELRRLASSYMRRERRDHTLQTTALVHEAYIKMVGPQNIPWQNRVHFFAVAAKIMRRILIDRARTRNYAKRGGGAIKLSLDEALVLTDSRAAELVALDDALNELAELDPRQSQVVELRFFGGLTVEETAQFLNISSDTVTRDWNVAKAWLYRQIMPGENHSK